MLQVVQVKGLITITESGNVEEDHLMYGKACQLIYQSLQVYLYLKLALFYGLI